MKTRTCHVLAIALTTALMSPFAFGQNSNAAAHAADRAQETPRPALPPAVNQPQPVAADPRMPTEQADPQELEEPMTSPKTPPVQSQGAANAAGQSAVTQRTAWAELDADGDGRVSSVEGNVDADFTSHFSMMDSDGDGFVTDAEYRAHAKTPQDESQDESQDNQPPPTPAQGAAHAAGHSSVVQRDMWSRLDTDGDGRISSVEGSVDADFGANFAMTDTDGDGFVSDAEYRAQAKAVHQGDPGDDAADDNLDDPDADDAPVDDRDER